MYRQNHVVTLDANGQIGDIIDPAISTELNSEVLVRWSASGKFKAVLRNVKDKKGNDQQYMEVWNYSQKTHNINLTALDKHGNVYEDCEFSCLEWSSCESKLLYVAEKKQPKAVSYFDRSENVCHRENPTSQPKDREPTVKGDQFVYRQDWGENLVGKHCPVPCILNLHTGQVTIPESLPSDISVCQAVWTPDCNGIVFTGYENEPYRLGMYFCRNRKSAIYHLDLSSQTCNIISVTDRSVRSPVFSPDGSRLIYVQNACHGPHQQCSQLMLYDWISKKTKVAVDVVQRPTDSRPFPGLYVGRLKQECWLDNNTILLHNDWRSCQTIIEVDVFSGEVKRLVNEIQFGFWEFCDLNERLLLAFRSAPNNSGHLVVGIVPREGDLSHIDWKSLHESSLVHSDVMWSVITLKPSTRQGNDIDFEAFIVKKEAESVDPEKKPPLIVWPHGGPHFIVNPRYDNFVATFCQLGFVLVLVNYRGSTGFGQDSIYSLPGFVGTNDVRDVQTAVEAVLEEGLADPERVAVTGVSHGGFLSTHMIGQYPDFYKVCAVRNPVTNVAVMPGETDIPSWAMTEAGIDFDFKMVPSAEMYAKMFKCSPMAYVNKVIAPTLIMLGADDHRIHPQQGIHYHKMLKAHGVKTRLLMYPDNVHRISKVDAEADCFMNIYTWITAHLSS
ncbi:acylamino-acid-releasing enzyme-like isoform X2 [Lytechinus pictus]